MPSLTSKAAPLAAVAVIFCLTCPYDIADAFSGVNLLSSNVRLQGTHLYQGKSGVIPPPVESKDCSVVLPTDSEGPISTQSSNQHQPSSTAVEVRNTSEDVPSTWNQALHRFFVGDVGPPLVVISIMGFIHARVQVPIPVSVIDAVSFASAIICWWIQEYAFHRLLLHTPFDWIGKSIHHAHHQANYFHVSIDPPGLLLGWLFTAHFAIKSILPWYLCLDATIGYALAGLMYEWSHYIVHTRVKPPTLEKLPAIPQSSLSAPLILALTSFSKLFSQMRDNHICHHRVDDQYWFAFSVPAMDDLFNTNPDVVEVRAKKEEICTGMENGR
ncbi:hypothetical protein ACHAWF_003714 [Thalassiosira exigua]